MNKCRGFSEHIEKKASCCPVSVVKGCCAWHFLREGPRKQRLGKCPHLSVAPAQPSPEAKTRITMTNHKLVLFQPITVSVLPSKKIIMISYWLKLLRNFDKWNNSIMYKMEGEITRSCLHYFPATGWTWKKLPWSGWQLRRAM